MKSKRERVHLGRRYEVKLWIPPESIAEVARNRTEGMVGYFMETAPSGRDAFIDYRNALRTLAKACYLQGINDAVEAETRRIQAKETPAPPEERSR